MSRLIKYALTFLLWRNYKVLIVTTLLLIFTIVIINMAHSDYLTWAQMQEPVVATGMSFIYKYCAYVALLVGFFVINHYANKRLEAEEAAQKGKGNAVLDKILKAKEKVTSTTKATFSQAKTDKEAVASAKAQVEAENQSHNANHDASDPFANIRNKTKLRTQAEVILAKKSKK
jgi:hypothetical protein